MDEIIFDGDDPSQPPMEGSFESDEIQYCYQAVFDPKTGVYLGTVDVTEQARKRRERERHK